MTTKTLRRRFFSIAGRLTRSARSPCIFPKAGPGKPSSVAPWRDCAPCHSPPDGARPVRWTTEPPGRFAPGRSLSVSCGTLAADLARRRRCGPSISPLHDCHTLQPARSYRGQSLTLPFPRLSSLVRPASLHPFGGFGLRAGGQKIQGGAGSTCGGDTITSSMAMPSVNRWRSPALPVSPGPLFGSSKVARRTTATA